MWTPVYISPLFEMAVYLGMFVLTIAVLYYTFIVGRKQLDLGKKEEIVLYGRNTKPVAGKY